MTNVPDTIWQLPDGTGEYSGITPDNIVDENDNQLVDPTDSSIAIISTDVSLTTIDPTVWTENPSS